MITGSFHSLETIEKIKRSNFGKLRSSETREKIKQAKLGIKLSEEHKKKIGLANLGKVLSDETKEKMRQSKLGKSLPPCSLETRRKRSQNMLGNTLSKDYKQSFEKREQTCPLPWNKGLTKYTSEKVAQIGERNKFLLKEHASLDDCTNKRCFVHGHIQNPSLLSWVMIDFLVSVGFEIIIPEQQFDTYRVDALLAEEWVAFEADGEYWHLLKEKQHPGYYKERDKFLMKNFNLPVVHLTGQDIMQIQRGLS